MLETALLTYSSFWITFIQLLLKESCIGPAASSLAMFIVCVCIGAWFGASRYLLRTCLALFITRWPSAPCFPQVLPAACPGGRWRFLRLIPSHCHCSWCCCSPLPTCLCTCLRTRPCMHTAQTMSASAASAAQVIAAHSVWISQVISVYTCWCCPVSFCALVVFILGRCEAASVTALHAAAVRDLEAVVTCTAYRTYTCF